MNSKWWMGPAISGRETSDGLLPKDGLELHDGLLSKEGFLPKDGLLPPDDLSRKFITSNAHGARAGHLGLTAETYTITVSGEDTGGRYCVVDMCIPPGGDPPPHRHSFEETVVVLEGKIEATFRGEKLSIKEGESMHIPANAPHQLRNISRTPARLLSISSPAGQDEFFRLISVPLSARILPPPRPTPEQREALEQHIMELALRFGMEILSQA